MATNRKNNAGSNSLVNFAHDLAKAINAVDTSNHNASVSQLTTIWGVAKEYGKPVSEADWADAIVDACREALAKWRNPNTGEPYTEGSAKVKLANYKAAIIRMTSGAADAVPVEGETWNAWRERNGLAKKKGANARSTDNASDAKAVKALKEDLAAAKAATADALAALETAKAGDGESAFSMHDVAEMATGADPSTTAGKAKIERFLAVFSTDEGYEAFDAFAIDYLKAKVQPVEKPKAKPSLRKSA
jgi:hypothetical protein